MTKSSDAEDNQHNETLANLQTVRDGPILQSPSINVATHPSATASRASFGPRVFISHSSKDTTFCKRLVSDIRAALGNSEAVWYDAAPDPDHDDHGGLAVGDPFPTELVHRLASANVSW